MKLSRYFKVSQEAIAFQTGSFGKEIENLFEALYKTDYKDNNVILDIFKLFEITTFNHTGLKIRFFHDDKTVGETYFKVLNINSVLTSKEYRKHIMDIDGFDKPILKALDFKKKNYVDLKNSKVTGIFSDFESAVIININFFKNFKITPGQMTALFLHEIGHLFTNYEFLDRQTTTNQILTAVTKSVINKDTVQEREMIFKTALEMLDIKSHEVEEVSKQTDLKVITAVCLKFSTEALESQLGVSNYDYSSCEQLADQFCTRHGYGRENIELQNILGYILQDYEKLAMTRRLINMNQVLATVIAGSTVLLGLFGVPLYSLLATILYSSMLIGKGESNKDYRYDNLRVRFLRIREDVVNYLKDKDLDPAYIKKALSDLEAMDKIIKDTGEARFLFDKIVDFINPNSKKVRTSYELQRDLETLAMNDFFIKSAKLELV